MVTGAVPFFERDSTKEAIQRLAEDDALVFFLGAGVSAESGLPAWRRLVERVVLETAERLGVAADSRPDFVRALVDQHGVITAAALAQSVLGSEATIEVVRQSLYSRVGFRPTPQFHAHTVADLVLQQHHDGTQDLAVVTTNYDRLLEMSLEDRIKQYNTTHPKAPLGLRPVSVVSRNEAVPADTIPVYHLHGLVDAQWNADVQSNVVGSRENTVVLGEREYASLQHGGVDNWQDEVVSELLSSGKTCVFAGMSLGDPNIIRYLTMKTDQRTSGRRYALLSTQSERLWMTTLPENVRENYEEALHRRLLALRVEPIHADYFVQVPQFLNEVLLYRGQKGGWDESMWYGNRLNNWRESMEQAGVICPSPPEFERCQKDLSVELQRVIEAEIVPHLAGDGIRLRQGERLALELWFRNNRTVARALELWGSSVSTWRNYEDLAKPTLGFSTTYSAVEAFMRGAYQFRTNGREGSRWQFQYTHLIRLEEEPWFNLPVGVLVLSSTLPDSEASISRLTPEAKRSLQALLTETGRQLSDPATAPVVLRGDS